MLRAWRMRHQCRDPATPWGWLTRICQHEAARIASRRRPSPLADGYEPAVTSPEDETLDRVAVGTAVAHLEALDRELIALRYRDDQTTERIAARLAMPEGTVKVRLHRARRQLRRVLDDD
jgi:RNA polymerase sigma-70 factor (ECF subfamily)